MPQGSILEGLGTIFHHFHKFFGMLPRRGPSITHSRNPSSDLFHVGRADAPKKMSNCRVIERLPRIARLPHLKTQTPRTPRTPRVKSSTTTAENKRVGRRWSPPGGLQSAAHRRCAKRARSQPNRFQDTLLPITARESERPSSLCRPRFLIPSLCLSPGGGGPPESRGKNAASPSCWASWVDFLPFPSVLQK